MSTQGVLLSTDTISSAIPGGAASVLAMFQAALGSNGVPATWSAVSQAIATNSPVFASTLANSSFNLGASLNMGDMHFSNTNATANLATITSVTLNLLASAINTASGSNISIQNNSSCFK